MTFPTRDNCDLDDPQEMFLPLLVAWPLTDHARIAFPIVYLKLVSQRLHELGAFMRCPECGHTKEPKNEWKPPTSTSPHWLSDPGMWRKSNESRPRSSKFDGVVPTRDLCDLSDPREMFAWMLAGLPGMRGAPMLFDSGWAMDTSEHLFDGGAMLECPCGYSKPPEKAYVAANLSGPHWLTNPGEWVPPQQQKKRAVDVEIDASLAKMSTRQQAELFKALTADENGDPIPSTPAGDVVSRMPAEYKTAILRRLRERDSA